MLQQLCAGWAAGKTLLGTFMTPIGVPLSFLFMVSMLGWETGSMVMEDERSLMEEVGLGLGDEQAMWW